MQSILDALRILYYKLTGQTDKEIYLRIFGDSSPIRTLGRCYPYLYDDSWYDELHHLFSDAP